MKIESVHEDDAILYLNVSPDEDKIGVVLGK
jgi:hypothetical protein